MKIEEGISIETYLAGVGRNIASMVDNEHQNCIATLPLRILYITSESASHGPIFPSFYYLNFMKFTFLGFHVLVGTHEDLSIDALTTNVGLTLTKLR